MSRAHSSSLRHTATSHVAVTSNDSVITDMWLYFCKLQLCSARVSCLLVPCMYCNQALTGVAEFLQPPPTQPTNPPPKATQLQQIAKSITIFCRASLQQSTNSKSRRGSLSWQQVYRRQHSLLAISSDPIHPLRRSFLITTWKIVWHVFKDPPSFFLFRHLHFYESAIFIETNEDCAVLQIRPSPRELAKKTNQKHDMAWCCF